MRGEERGLQRAHSTCSRVGRACRSQNPVCQIKDASSRLYLEPAVHITYAASPSASLAIQKEH